MKKLLIGPAIAAVAIISFALADEQVQSVKITSEPAGAMLFIDGAYEGLTPLTLELDHGEYRLRLMRRAYRDRHAVLSIPKDEPAVNYKLVRASKASLRITSTPPEALVFLNGREEGVTPLVISGLDDDLYQVRVQLAHHQTYQTEVEIKDGKDGELDVRLQSNMRIFYENVLRNNPEDIDRYTEFGHLLLVEGDFDYAREIFMKAVNLMDQRHPLDTMNRLLIELFKVHSGQFNFTTTERMPAFRKSFSPIIEEAIIRAPFRNPNYTQLITIYFRFADTATVGNFIQRLYESDPKRNVFREYGVMYFSRGEIQTAIELLERAAEIEKEPDFDLLFALGRAYQRTGRLDDAVAQFELCLKAPADADKRLQLLEELIRALMSLNQHDRAYQYFTEARADESSGNRRWGALEFSLLLESGRCAEAEAIAQRLIESDNQQEVREGRNMMAQIRQRCQKTE